MFHLGTSENLVPTRLAFIQWQFQHRHHKCIVYNKKQSCRGRNCIDKKSQNRSSLMCNSLWNYTLPSLIRFKPGFHYPNWRVTGFHYPSTRAELTNTRPPVNSASGNARLSTRPVLTGNGNRSPVNSGSGNQALQGLYEVSDPGIVFVELVSVREQSVVITRSIQ